MSCSPTLPARELRTQTVHVKDFDAERFARDVRRRYGLSATATEITKHPVAGMSIVSVTTDYSVLTDVAAFAAGWLTAQSHHR